MVLTTVAMVFHDVNDAPHGWFVWNGEVACDTVG